MPVGGRLGAVVAVPAAVVPPAAGVEVAAAVVGVPAPVVGVVAATVGVSSPPRVDGVVLIAAAKAMRVIAAAGAPTKTNQVRGIIEVSFLLD
jgi:hypothetical protein